MESILWSPFYKVHSINPNRISYIYRKVTFLSHFSIETNLYDKFFYSKGYDIISTIEFSSFVRSKKEKILKFFINELYINWIDFNENLLLFFYEFFMLEQSVNLFFKKRICSNFQWKQSAVWSFWCWLLNFSILIT